MKRITDGTITDDQKSFISTEFGQSFVAAGWDWFDVGNGMILPFFLHTFEDSNSEQYETYIGIQTTQAQIPISRDDKCHPIIATGSEHFYSVPSLTFRVESLMNIPDDFLVWSLVSESVTQNRGSDYLMGLEQAMREVLLSEEMSEAAPADVQDQVLNAYNCERPNA